MRTVPRLLAAALAALILHGLGGEADAAPLYTINFYHLGISNNSVSSPTPFARDTTLAVVGTGGANGVFTGGASVGAAEVRVAASIDALFTPGLNGGMSWGTAGTATTDDFLITGPAGPTVAGELHLHLVADFSVYGGNFSGHAAQLGVNASAYVNSNAGGYSLGNAGGAGNGFLTGQTGSHLDVPFTIAGTFPVGFPFSVTLTCDARSTVYGNGANSPGGTFSDAGGTPADPSGRGLGLEEVGGQVMTLPPGYTLDSASWNIADNHLPAAVAVEASLPDGGMDLRVTGANPSGARFRLALSVPRAAMVRADVFDVAGHRVRALADGWRSAGEHGLDWDGRADDGNDAGVGIFFVRARWEGEQRTAKLVRVR